jgi:ABC-type antimicrobial peptide transport system permease subunit
MLRNVTDGPGPATIGVRVALGAGRSQIVRLVLRQSLPPVLVGLAVGLFVAIWLARFVQAMLFEVAALDPMVLLGAVAGLALVGTAACALPARRAATISPIVAIRG